MIKLREYQEEAIKAILEYWRDGGGFPLVVLPTGAGKSLVIAELCRRLLADYPSMRIGIVTHIKELVQQNAAELLKVWPQAPIGIYSAGLGRRDLRSKIMFMGIQSVHNKKDLLGDFDILLVDEAHLIPRNSDTMYGRFIDSCKDAVPDMRIVGLTATPYRLDSGRLDEGKGKLFDDIVYDANVRDLIEAGFLSPLISKATLARISTEGMHRRAGEFIQSEMDERARIPSVVEAAVKEIVDLGKDRAGWLAFCTGVEHSQQVRDEIRKHGISCESVTGDTPAGERDSIIRAYKDRRIRCLTSVGVLTTGFNAPHVDLIALLRPTLSTGLYCLDAETEILTSHGWMGIGEIQVGAVAPTLNMESGKGQWSRVLDVMDRPMTANETWVEYTSPRANFRVTGDHRMLVATDLSAGRSDYHIEPAFDLATRKAGAYIPTAVEIEQPGVPLTDAELYFIGMMMTDGTWTATCGSISQSERHPQIIERIEDSLQKCGIGYSKRRITSPDDDAEIKEKHARWVFHFSAGKPKPYALLGKRLNGTMVEWKSVEGTTGYRHLMPFLDKDFAPALMALSKSQFITLLTAIHDGDGFKKISVDYVPRSWSICSARKSFIERIQALAAIHGMTGHLRWEHHGRKNPIAILTITPQDWRSIGGFGNRPQVTVAPATNERVWCIETETGTIITRRRGKVTVMGNCQMVGRAFRLAPGKENALILDFAGNVVRHGPVDAISPQKSGGGAGKREEGGEREETIKAKECPRCQTIVALSVYNCPGCDFEWPAPPPRHEAEAAADAPILTTEATAPKFIAVDAVRFSRHSKVGSPDSLRVTYEAIPTNYSQWLCFEHQGFARQKASSWWARVGGRSPVPKTVAEAIERAPDEIRKIIGVEVRTIGKYPEVIKLYFGEGLNQRQEEEPKPTTYLSRMDIRDEDIPF